MKIKKIKKIVQGCRKAFFVGEKTGGRKIKQ